MKNVINRALAAEKKIIILAISAILVANVSAQEQKKECKGKQFTKEERVEFEIRRFTNELMLSDRQAEKFAVIYREYSDEMGKIFEKNAPKENLEPGKELTEKELDQLAKARFEGLRELANLQSKYYDKFRKDLSARQVEKVLRLNEPFGPKPCCGKCGKHEGQRPEGQRFEGPGPQAPGPGNFDQRGPQHKHGPRPEGPAPKAE
jgi:hypothetical protein